MTRPQDRAIERSGIPRNSLERVETLDGGRTLRVYYRSYLGLGDESYTVMDTRIPVEV